MKARFMPGLLKGEAGNVMIMVAVSIVALFAFALLAIDGAILMATKTQLQNAADAAALAGASGLLEGDQTLARQRAIDFASFNMAVQETLSPVLITDADITFPQPDRITVRTHRTEATGDPLRTHFRRIIDLALTNTADVTATATAAFYDVCFARCLMPWAIPDRWNDVDGDAEYDVGEPYDPIGTGYAPPADVGRQVVLKTGNPSQTIAPGIYFPVCYPPLGRAESPETGGAAYEAWITGCEPHLVGIGDSLLVEPGAIVGPTRHGVEELIARDPGAHWDSATQSVAGSSYGTSPRVIVVPFFDPREPPSSGRHAVYVVKLGGFFIEDLQGGGEVVGRFMEVLTPGEPCASSGGPSFLSGMGLVE